MTFWSKPLIFVSYSRKDQQAVDDLVRDLTSKGFRTWIDRQSIQAGNWRSQIKKGLRKSNFFLACLSPNTENPGEVLQYEFDTALEVQREGLEGEQYLIPVRLVPCKIPKSLEDLQYFDLFDSSQRGRLMGILRSKSRFRTAFAASVASIAILTALAVYLQVRTPPEQTEFLDARTQGKAAALTRTVSLGVTLWKMQPSIQADPVSVREIVHPSSVRSDAKNTVDWTPVRLSTGEEFRLGDNFQIGIETSRSGYLYVIDRALTEKGVAGPPRCIFPTARIRNGSAYVWPGRITRLPDRSSDPPYWRFQSKHLDYTGEVLTLILSSQPIEELECSGAGEETVSEEALGRWIDNYGRNVRSKRFDERAIRLTPEEAAARDTGAPMTRAAPLPQMVFQAERSADSPIATEFSIHVTRK